MTVEVPQGSVMGPLLWNILYNDVLELRMEDDTKLISFADDLTMFAVSSIYQEGFGGGH